jgi:hypothetical protein
MNCDNCYKKSYESKGMALAVIDELIESDVQGSKLLTTYRCEECQLWFLTSKNNG